MRELMNSLSVVRIAAITVSIVLCGVAAAQSQSVPRYNVDAHCKEVASVGGNYSEMLFGACMDEEQGSYNSLKPAWSHLPGAMRAHCDEVATVGGSGSYMLLKACVDQEQAAARSNANKSFHY
jgi:hypothetical protein